MNFKYNFEENKFFYFNKKLDFQGAPYFLLTMLTFSCCSSSQNFFSVLEKKFADLRFKFLHFQKIISVEFINKIINKLECLKTSFYIFKYYSIFLPSDPLSHDKDIKVN